MTSEIARKAAEGIHENMREEGPNLEDTTRRISRAISGATAELRAEKDSLKALILNAEAGLGKVQEENAKLREIAEGIHVELRRLWFEEREKR